MDASCDIVLQFQDTNKKEIKIKKKEPPKIVDEEMPKQFLIQKNESEIIPRKKILENEELKKSDSKNNNESENEILKLKNMLIETNKVFINRM